jgi:protocatechuate 3,4-dioxygenase, beta subunit
MADSFRPLDEASQPPYLHPPYASTVLRSPSRALVALPDGLTVSETTGPGPVLAREVADDSDLTTNAGTGEQALGERIVVTGRVLDEDGTPVPGTVVEVWQANAAGRYRHPNDQHPAPLDPNFVGAGRFTTGPDGIYRFLTIRPGAYPWGNHPNAWRPAHIHLSVFGPAVVTRLVTQMYFPGDPLQDLDPILGSIRDVDARRRLVADYDHDVTEPDWALGFRFDIVLRGPRATPATP